MKSVIYSALIILATILPSKGAIVAPIVTLQGTTANRQNYHEANFSITIGITAPAENDIYLDRSYSPLNLNLYFKPGDGIRWQFVDAPGSPARPATLHSETFTRVAGSSSDDTAQQWRILAGNTGSFRLSMSISMNPFEEETPQRWVALAITHANWDADQTDKSEYFADLGPDFRTSYVQLGPIPEPTVTALGLLGISALATGRRRHTNRT